MGKSIKKSVIVSDIDGNILEQYPSIKEAARSHGCSHTTMMYRISTGRAFNGFIFKLADPNEEPLPLTVFLTKKEYTFDDALDEDKYTIVQYQTVNNICITPCPFKPSPRPMVGNGQCVKCSSFKGKNKTNHQVACSFKKYRI